MENNIEIKKNRQNNLEVEVELSHAYVKNRDKIPSNKFLFPEEKAFPITGPDSVVKALHDYGRSPLSHKMTYEAFVHKVWRKAKELGYESGMPESTKKKYNLK